MKPISTSEAMSISKIIAFIGFWYGGIIGSFFFENEQGATVRVNGERYRATLNEFLFPKIEEDDMDDIWFQQNGLLPHNQRNN